MPRRGYRHSSKPGTRLHRKGFKAAEFPIMSELRQIALATKRADAQARGGGNGKS